MMSYNLRVIIVIRMMCPRVIRMMSLSYSRIIMKFLQSEDDYMILFLHFISDCIDEFVPLRILSPCRAKVTYRVLESLIVTGVKHRPM